MTIDSVVIFHAKEAFGMTDVVGAAFGNSATGVMAKMKEQA